VGDIPAKSWRIYPRPGTVASAAGAKPEIPGSGIQGVFSLISGQNLFGLDF